MTKDNYDYGDNWVLGFMWGLRRNEPTWPMCMIYDMMHESNSELNKYDVFTL